MNTPDVITTALVGTAQRDRANISTGTPIDVFISKLPEGTPERALLLSAGAWAVYRQAGQRAEHLTGLVEPSKAEQLEVCSHAVSRLLYNMFLGVHHDVLSEALEWLRTAGLRLPFELLPLALNIQPQAMRSAVHPVLGERGLWLSQFNPDWAWVQNYLPASEAALSPDAETTWQESTTGQRCEILRRLRAIDPAKARTWLEATWKQEKADARLELLKTLEIGLSADDESFLDRVLDDRALSVKSAVPALLARIPTSAFATRMMNRADTMLSGDQGKLELTLAGALDKAGQRDGIIEKPPPGLGERAWWLIQILACVPLAHWEERFQLTPPELIAAADAGTSGNVLLEGWSRAAQIFDADTERWSGLLWNWWQRQRQKKMPGGATPSDICDTLLTRMPPREAEHRIQQMMIESALPEDRNWDDLLSTLPDSWSDEFGKNYLNMLRQYLASLNPGAGRYQPHYDPWFNSLEIAAIRLPPSCFATALKDLMLPEGEDWQARQWHSLWDEFTETLRTRQRFMEELAK
jgi:hypothetical protein